MQPYQSEKEEFRVDCLPQATREVGRVTTTKYPPEMPLSSC